MLLLLTNVSSGNAIASGSIDSIALGVVSGSAVGTSGTVNGMASGSISSCNLVAVSGYASGGGFILLSPDRTAIVEKRISIIKIRTR